MYKKFLARRGILIDRYNRKNHCQINLINLSLILLWYITSSYCGITSSHCGITSSNCGVTSSNCGIISSHWYQNYLIRYQCQLTVAFTILFRAYKKAAIVINYLATLR